MSLFVIKSLGKFVLKYIHQLMHVLLWLSECLLEIFSPEVSIAFLWLLVANFTISLPRPFS